MKAIVYTDYGPPAVLHLKDTATPGPRDKELLVKVKAATVSEGVIWARRGKHADSKYPFFM